MMMEYFEDEMSAAFKQWAWHEALRLTERWRVTDELPDLDDLDRALASC